MNDGHRSDSDVDLRAIKSAMSQVSTASSGIRAFIVCTAAVVCYVSACFGALTSHSVWIALIFCGLKAFTMAVLFVVGHDACHGALTPWKGLNQIIGRLAFLPTWHPYACWDLGHNRMHHCWTNLKGRDYVWTPLSVEDYRRLPPVQRALQRLYRTLPGLGLYYAKEIWWRHLIYPTPGELARMSPWVQRSDRALVLAFVIAEVGIAIASASAFGRSAWSVVIVSVVLPHAIWNWLMGLVILLHHTHPKVRWFETKEEWSFYQAQVSGTVHVVFPKWIGLLLCNIMEHTAHHVDPKIPLYRLRDAQRAIEARFGDEVIVTHFRLQDAIEICQRCRLYDYERKQWLDWHGNPTSAA